MKVVSLGGGVQSSAMLLMALAGKLPEKPDCAVFADTGWEPKAVYEFLELLKVHTVGFPIHTLMSGNIRRALTDPASRYVSVPCFLSSGGMGRRQCTDEFKLKPIRRWCREHGATRREPVEMWIGISTDEAHRMKPSRVGYIVNRFPLIDAGLSRTDCDRYLNRVWGLSAPKSACIGCPYHDDSYWAALRAKSPAEFADACDVDDAIRETRRIRETQYLHRSLVPLREIQEFRHERQGRMFVDAFGNECEGLCGT